MRHKYFSHLFYQQIIQRKVNCLHTSVKRKKQRGRAHLRMLRQNIDRLRKRPRCSPKLKKCNNALKLCHYEMEFKHTNKESCSVHLLGDILITPEWHQNDISSSQSQCSIGIWCSRTIPCLWINTRRLLTLSCVFLPHHVLNKASVCIQHQTWAKKIKEN